MDNNLNEIIKDNNNLIYAIINKYTNYYEFDDLYQVAVIGLINAYKNYKNDYNTKFSTYAYTYIFGEVNKYINDFKTIKLNKEYIKLYKKINEAKTILTQKLMHVPCNYELSLFLEIDEQLIENIDMLTRNIDSLDKPICSDEKELYLYDIISINEKDQLENIWIKDELNKLNEEERKILLYRYFEDKTQEQISEGLGINQVSVSRIERKVLTKMKQNMEYVGKK